MDVHEAASAIATALAKESEFEGVTIGPDGSVTVPLRGASVVPEHHAGVERIAAGLRMTASRLRPTGEPVTVSRAELMMWFEGRDGLEEATPRCDQCLVPLELHPTAAAWVCPSCGAVGL
ncbi:hypothetical protein [Microbacterium maritypicum]